MYDKIIVYYIFKINIMGADLNTASGSIEVNSNIDVQLDSLWEAGKKIIDELIELWAIQEWHVNAENLYLDQAIVYYEVWEWNISPTAILQVIAKLNWVTPSELGKIRSTSYISWMSDIKVGDKVATRQNSDWIWILQKYVK